MTHETEAEHSTRLVNIINDNNNTTSYITAENLTKMKIVFFFISYKETL
jgi:hypothetical protein